MSSPYGTATKRTITPSYRPYHDVPMTARRRMVLDLVIDYDGSTAAELVKRSPKPIIPQTMHDTLNWLVDATMVCQGKKRPCTAGRYKSVKTWYLVK